MTDSTTTTASFNPFEPGFDAWPYDQYTRLRDHDPVHWSDMLCGWVLTRFDDVTRILRDPRISSDFDNATPSPVVDLIQSRSGDLFESHTVVLTDDPEHARLRRLIQTPFTVRNVERLRESLVRRVDGAMADLVAQGRMELVADLAYPLPVSVFCDMLGIPPEEAGADFRRWTMAVAKSLDLVITAEEYAACMGEIENMRGYLSDLIDQKRAHPGDDVLSALLAARYEGSGLTHDELLVQLVTLYVAGHEPTTALVSNGIAHLLAAPDQYAALVADPSLLTNAVHEMLRLDGPNQFLRRIALEPITFDGADGPVTVGAGDVIYVGVGAANHDPAKFGDDAGSLRIGRPNASDHVQFGGGVHACLGSHLARMQAEAMLGPIVARLPNLAMDGPVEWSGRITLRSVSAVPLRWDAP
jgi:cytochrome P450